MISRLITRIVRIHKKRVNTMTKPKARQRSPQLLLPARVFDATEIGQVIRARRKELGYTQEYVAALMGISPRLMGEIERGRGTVGIQKVLYLATGLGIDFTLSIRGKG